MSREMIRSCHSEWRVCALFIFICAMSRFISSTIVTHTGGTEYTRASTVEPSSSLCAASKFLWTLNSLSCGREARTAHQLSARASTDPGRERSREEATQSRWLWQSHGPRDRSLAHACVSSACRGTEGRSACAIASPFDPAATSSYGRRACCK